MKKLSSKIDAGLELISALGAIELKPIEIRDLLYKLITKDFSKIANNHGDIITSDIYGRYKSFAV